MFSIPRAVRILLAAQPVDLRNGVDGLAAIVRSGWHENVYAGHLFVFVSRRRDRVKVLTWDAGGFVVVYKVSGTFNFSARASDSGANCSGTRAYTLLIRASVIFADGFE